MNTGSWTIWFARIPRAWWIIAGLFIFVWLLTIAIRKRVKRFRSLDAGPGISVSRTPLFGWIPIGTLKYAEVLWKIRAPAPEPMAPWTRLNRSEISPSCIEVEIPPRCPKCETELEQSHSFWGGCIWKCVQCGFQKRNKDSYYKEEERVEKIARRNWEKQMQEASGL
jgi:ribosomal protein L37AE/L43A